MHFIQGFLSLVGRLMIVAIFLASAVMNKIPQFTAVADVMAAKGIQQPKIMLAGAIAFLIIGSVSIIIGYHARLGALLLLVFLAAATYYFHAFWKLAPDAPEVQGEMIHFMKNVGLMGTMVFIMANGPGPWSLDARSRSVTDTEQVPEG
jgi:putative oxidoreductase